MSFDVGAPLQGTPTWEVGPGGGSDTIYGVTIGADGTITLPGGMRVPNFPSRPTGGTGPEGLPGGTVPINPDRATPAGQIGSGGFITPGRDPRPGDFNGVGQVGSVGAPDSNFIKDIYQTAIENLREFINPDGTFKLAVPGVGLPTPDRPGAPNVGSNPSAPATPGTPPSTPQPQPPATPNAPPSGGNLDDENNNGGWTIPTIRPRPGDPVIPTNSGDPGGGSNVPDTDLFNFGIGTPNEANANNASQSQSTNLLFDPQANLIQSLLPQLQAMANQQGQDIGNMAPGLSQGLQGQGQDFLGQLGGGQNQYLQQLGNFNGAANGGQDVFNQLASGNNQFQMGLANPSSNQFIDGQIDALGTDINRQLQRQNVGIGQEATMGGARGGSRQGVAEGIAQEGALNEFATGSANLRAQDAALQQQLQSQGQSQALQAQMFGASGLQGGSQFQTAQELSGLQGASAGTNQLSGINQGGASQGLGQLQNQFNLGLSQFGAEFSPFANLAGLFDPIMQANSQSASSGQSSSDGGFNFSLGI